jgi:hypothetical protein
MDFALLIPNRDRERRSWREVMAVLEHSVFVQKEKSRALNGGAGLLFLMSDHSWRSRAELCFALEGSDCCCNCNGGEKQCEKSIKQFQDDPLGSIGLKEPGIRADT